MSGEITAAMPSFNFADLFSEIGEVDMDIDALTESDGTPEVEEGKEVEKRLAPVKEEKEEEEKITTTNDISRKSALELGNMP